MSTSREAQKAWCLNVLAGDWYSYASYGKGTLPVPFYVQGKVGLGVQACGRQKLCFCFKHWVLHTFTRKP